MQKNSPVQADFMRIKREVSDPLALMFGYEVNDYFLGAMVEDLHGYSDEQLRHAMLTVRRTCKRTPSLAAIIEAAETYRPPATTQHTNYGAPNYFSRTEELMRSPIGQRALEMGIGNCLYYRCMEDGLTNFDEYSLDAIKRRVDEGLREFCALRPGAGESGAVRIGRMDGKVHSALAGLWEGIQSGEQRLYEKYYGNTAAPLMLEAHEATL